MKNRQINLNDWGNDYWQGWRDCIGSISGVSELERDILYHQLLDSFFIAAQPQLESDDLADHIERTQAAERAESIRRWEEWSGETYSPIPDMA